MEVVTTRTIRANFSELAKKAINGVDITVKRPHGENIVVISQDEYNRLKALESTILKVVSK